MPEAYFDHETNVVGALALALSDQMRLATEAACGLRGALPAALVALHEWAGGSPIDVLAGAIRVSHSRAVRVVDQLEEAGLAQRRPDPADGRAALVELTVSGGMLGRRVARARATVLTEAVAGLSASERTSFGALAGTVLRTAVRTRRDAHVICRLCDVDVCGYESGRCPVTQAADVLDTCRVTKQRAEVSL